MCVNKKKIIVVAGPTAVGKSDYAIKLAKEMNGEIVSLDSVQVYKYLDIGSGKISKEQMQDIPHYMINEVEPTVNLNVKEFKDLANKYIELIISKEKIPILVGGTGFYIRAVLYDTDFLYEDNELAQSIRDDLYNKRNEFGIEYILNELKLCDKESFDSINICNERRLIRALEFYKLHGFPISEHNKNEKNKKSKFDFDFLVLNMERKKLYERINTRVDDMMQKGLVNEVKELINMGVTKDNNSMKSIGYSELYDYCLNNDNNNIILKEKIELIKQHTRNYAKRQLTWFRSQEKIKWINL